MEKITLMITLMVLEFDQESQSFELILVLIIDTEGVITPGIPYPLLPIASSTQKDSCCSRR